MYSDILTEALTWEGVPYRHQQHSRYGCDCVGLLIGVGKATGRMALDYQPASYTRDWQLHTTRDRLRDEVEAVGWQAVALPDVLPGHVLVFQYALAPSHAGIYLPGAQLLHSTRGARRVVRHGFHLERQQKHLVAAYAFPEVRA